MVIRKIRVLFVGFAYIVSVYQSKLKALQDSACVDVAWLAPKRWNMRTWNRIIPLEIRHQGIKMFPVDIWFLNGVNGGYLYPTKAFLDAIKRFKPDILHYEQEVFSLSAFQAAVWANILKIPFTAFCWENVEKDLPFYRRWTVDYVLHTARAIVVGNSEAGNMLRKWGYLGKMAILPQIGVDTTLFHPRPPENSRDEFTIGYVGRLVPEKGVDLIFDAAQHLLGAGIKLRVVVCGGGVEEANLRAYAERLGIADHIVWRETVLHDQVPDILTTMDVLVLPSRTVEKQWKEQFGHVLIEAMAMGIPVIGSDSGAIPEVIGRPDLIFQENDSQGLTSILARLIVDVQWVREISEFLQRRAVDEYSDQHVAEVLTSIWRELLPDFE